ncbi:MAG: hypothetical protein QG670_1353 [Thermoproteota archaeon]|nr:hypothetical protein [Thermoproteota archaeon]
MIYLNILFHGGAKEVGGSCILVENDNNRVALDYGIKVEKGLSYDAPKRLDAVVITHAHLDHSGNLLTLSDGNTAIVGSEATRDVSSELLNDLIKVQRLNGVDIPYSYKDVNKITDLWISREKLALPGMEISLYPAGHVLGARMAYLEAEGKKVLYTGDFCLHDTEILDGANLSAFPREPDVLIMESTYGCIVRPTREELINTLFKSIIETMERRGNILIPTFAFHRIQEMARRIDTAMGMKILPRYNTYIISRLAERITEYFGEYKMSLKKSLQDDMDPFRYERIKSIKKVDAIREPAMVICTPGFGQAGISRELLYEWAEDEDNSIIINTGYLPEDSPLNMAKEKGVIKNDGESVEVKADVKQIELSGHADQIELVQFVKTIRPKRTFLVHGDPDQILALEKKISEFTEVTIPENHEKFKI